MITVTDITTLDTDQTQQSIAETTQLVQDLNPNIDVKRGVLYDLLLYTSGVLAQVNQTNTDLIRQSISLNSLKDNPTLSTDSSLVEDIAANYRLTIGTGTAASGLITVLVNKQASIIIPNAASFTANTGVVYKTNQIYTARTNSSDVVSSTDVYLNPLGNGTYSFNISVTATTSTATGNLKQSSQLTPSFTIPNLVSAYAANGFTGGTDAETITALIARLPTGICQKSLSNRMTIDGLIRTTAGLETVKANSIIGYGDDEMIRYHSVIPFGFGGRVDVYSRTSDVVDTTVITKTATLVTKLYSGVYGLWQFSLTRDDMPGFYEVAKITPTTLTGSGYQIVTDTRANDLTITTGEDATASTSFIPDVNSTLESAYSRYQTTAIQFIDTDTSTSSMSPGDTLDYGIAINGMPNIDVVQDLLSDRSTRSNFGDCLVKAPVPCFVSLNIYINRNRNTTAPNTTTVTYAIANMVNSLGFPGSLQASQIASIVQTNLPTTSTVTSVAMSGRILRPDNTTTNLASTSVLTIPDDPTNLVSARTTSFILDPSDITLTITIVDPISV